MHSSRRLSALAATAAATTFALAAGGASAHAQQPSHGHWWPGPWTHSGSVFVQNDNPAGNAISVYDRRADGTLTAAGSYATGGDGGQLQGSQVDHLSSEGSLQYDALTHELFAVNAGSNTITSFSVSGDRLQRDQVISSGGQFPSSITVHGDLVYVLNALDGGSIQGYRLWDGSLAPIPGSQRSLGLNPTATPQFVNAPGQIAFSPDGRQLIVSTKSNGNDIDVFGVDWTGRPSATPVITTDPGATPFGVAFEGPDRIAVAAAGTNSVQSYTLGSNGSLTLDSTVATGQQATCWITADGPFLFASNAGSGSESTLFAPPVGAPSLTATTSTDPGTVDATTSPDGRTLYVQTGASGIVDEYSVGNHGALTEIGSVTVPDAVGGEGIATS